MKKLLIIILTIALLVTISGCRPQEEPTPTPPQNPPQPTVEYPYGEIEAENIEGVEVYREAEKTPILEDSQLIAELTTLIQNAEYIENVRNVQQIEIKLGMIIYLKEEMLESKQVIISYDENTNKLFIGPEGREFIIRSQELVEFMESQMRSKLVIVEENALPGGAREWLAQFLQEKGAYVYQHPDATYIKVTTDQKPTGGYRIQVREFDEEAYPQEIKIEIIEPDKDAMVTQAITFPTIYLKVYSEQATQYQVKTVDGEEYDMENKLVFAKLEIPQENNEITTPVRIKGKIIAFEASFVVRILDEKENIIHEEVLQADYGGPNWGNFDEEIIFPKPETESGSIELGEYSAKDGTYLLREKVEVRFK